jgi:hypothetical protein
LHRYAESDVKPSFWEEVEPVLKHGAAAALLVLVSAGLVRLVEWALPRSHADIITAIDHYSGIVVLLLFSTNTIAILAIRMFGRLKREIRQVSSAKDGE